MVADYAADFTRLGLLPVPASSTLCARQAKKPLYVCGGGGGKGLGNDSRKSARACRASLKWGFHFHLKFGIRTDTAESRLFLERT